MTIWIGEQHIEFEIVDYGDYTFSYIASLFSEFLKYIRKNDINYIEILDRDQGYIFINKENENENEWDYKTLQMCDLLNRLGFDAFLSEEDYGYIDVIVLNDIW